MALFQHLTAMSHSKDIQTLHEVSGILSKAFQEVHRITGNHLRNQSNQPPKPKKREEHKPREEEQQQDAPTEKKVSKKEVKQAKIKEKNEGNHPDKPKRPMNSYARFNKDNMENIKKEYPHLKQSQLMQVCGALWSSTTEEGKKPYEDQYKRDKAEYEIAIAHFYREHPEEQKKTRKRSVSSQ